MKYAGWIIGAILVIFLVLFVKACLEVARAQEPSDYYLTDVAGTKVIGPYTLDQCNEAQAKVVQYCGLGNGLQPAPSGYVYQMKTHVPVLIQSPGALLISMANCEPGTSACSE